MLNKLVKFNNNFLRSITSSAVSLNKLQAAVSHPVNEINIKKLKLNDKELSETILTIKSKHRKIKEQKIIVEGNVLIKEALSARLKPDKLIFSDARKITELHKEIKRIVGPNVANTIEYLKVPERDLTFYATLTTCPGVIGIFDKPASIPNKENALPVTVISDGCKEPNNVGALLRVCNSLPARKLLLPKGNVDIWDTKSIRGSSGSVFYFPTETHLTWEEINEKVPVDSLILVADNNLSRYSEELIVNYDEIPNDLLDASRQYCVIIGGEAQGISNEARLFAKNRDYRVVNIPIDPTANSLNISNALSIILFEIRRRLKEIL